MIFDNQTENLKIIIISVYINNYYIMPLITIIIYRPILTNH